MVAANEEITPLKWCTVRLSEVRQRDSRLEASVFDIEAKAAHDTVLNGRYPAVPLCGENGLANAYVCGRFKRIWVKHSRYPIYQPSAITVIAPKPDGYLSKRTDTNIEELRVHKNQVLLTCSGTIGKVGYVSNTLDNFVFSHDLLRIDCKHEHDAGFIYAYLKSRIGNSILLTNKYGAVITHIEPEHLATIPVPDAPIELKKRIHDLVSLSYALRDRSNDLMSEAQKCLSTALAIPPLGELATKSEVEAFSVRLGASDMRFDASYHIPIVSRIIAHMKKNAAEVVPLGNPYLSSGVILPGRFKRVYVEPGHGRPFIGGKQIGELDPSGKKYLSNVRHGKRIAQQLELHENMTLITCSGTIGKVALVPKHWENWAASQHIIRVVPARENVAGYIYAFLASEFGKPLIVRGTYGSVVDEITDDFVRSIPVPLLKNSEDQESINALVLEANEKRYRAYLTEKEALRIMNQEVLA